MLHCSSVSRRSSFGIDESLSLEILPYRPITVINNIAVIELKSRSVEESNPLRTLTAACLHSLPETSPDSLQGVNLFQDIFFPLLKKHYPFLCMLWHCFFPWKLVPLDIWTSLNLESPVTCFCSHSDVANLIFARELHRILFKQIHFLLWLPTRSIISHPLLFRKHESETLHETWSFIAL